MFYIRTSEVKLSKLFYLFLVWMFVIHTCKYLCNFFAVAEFESCFVYTGQLTKLIFKMSKIVGFIQSYYYSSGSRVFLVIFIYTAKNN